MIFCDCQCHCQCRHQIGRCGNSCFAGILVNERDERAEPACSLAQSSASFQLAPLARLAETEVVISLGLVVSVPIRKVSNVFHHHVGQPITSDKNAWQHQLMLRIFNFIAIKQGACIRRAHIRFRRYLCIFSARARVMPSPATVPTAPYS